MKGKSVVLFIVLSITLLLFASGCDTMSERFLPSNTDDRLLNIEDLENPATVREPFTFPNNITLKRGSDTSLEVGFFNTLPVRTTVFVSGLNTRVGFGEAQTKNTILCRDKNEYEYTLEFDSPLVNVSVNEGVAFEVSITDDHNIMADMITCPISLVDTQSSKIIYTEKVNITVTE